MRFTGERHLRAGVDEVWEALHEREMLRAAIPGCERLIAAGPGAWNAVLAARVGPVTDTYRGSFTIADLRPGTSLHVHVDGRGRCGRLELDLHVALDEGLTSRTTMLTYDATASVAGLVSRLGVATLTVAGGHLTGCFFRDLDRALTGTLNRTSTRTVVPLRSAALAG